MTKSESFFFMSIIYVAPHLSAPAGLLLSFLSLAIGTYFLWDQIK